MAPKQPRRVCPECEDRLEVLDRRTFIAAVGGTCVAAGLVPLTARRALSAPTRSSGAETAVARLFQSLSDEQRRQVVLPWDDNRRLRISANWKVTDATVGSFSAQQQQLIDEILRGVLSPDGYQRMQKQMQADYGGVKNYAVAIFGDPEKEQFLFELTGRHLTLRADGDSVPGAAFGGPIVYGHGATGNSDGNLFHYQTKRANEVFQALDPEQRKKALLARAPAETAVQLRDPGAELPGIAGGELSADQQELLLAVLRDILMPYRKEDVDEAMACLQAGGGVQKLHIAFYQTGDLGDDGHWDIWRLESPTLVCHFRGAPHVHAYINIARREA
jgi:hypothetical protein